MHTGFDRRVLEQQEAEEREREERRERKRAKKVPANMLCSCCSPYDGMDMSAS